VERIRRKGSASPYQLLCWRETTKVLWRGRCSVLRQRGLRRDGFIMWRFTSLADLLHDLESTTARPKFNTRAWPAREDPTSRFALPLSASAVSMSLAPAVADDFAPARIEAVHTPLGIMLDGEDSAQSKCIRCNTCDGYPCLFMPSRRPGSWSRSSIDAIERKPDDQRLCRTSGD